MPYLYEYLKHVGDRLNGMEIDTVSVDPDPSDVAAQRKVISTRLFDLDKQASVHQFKHIWVPRYENQRTIRKNGYGRLPQAYFTAPASGTYTLTVWGFGTTASLAYNATAQQIQAAIQAANAQLASFTVSGTYPNYVIDFVSDEYALEASAGTLQSGLGYAEVSRPFTRALRRGDTYLMTALLPFENQDNFTGIIPAINQALARMTFIDRLPFTLTSTDDQTFALDGYPFLETRDQVTALYEPTSWELTTTFTPPASGTYTLTLTTHVTSGPTAALSFDATAAQIQAALRALAGCELLQVTGTSAPYTVVLPSTWYYHPTLTASAGTVGPQTRRRLYPLRRAASSFRVVLEGERRYLEIDDVFPTGHTVFLGVEIPGNSKVCPQVDYQTPGTTWTWGSNQTLKGYYDQAVLGVEEVGTIAYYYACKTMASRGPATDREFWLAQEFKAGQAAASIKLRDLPDDPKPQASALWSGVGGWGTKGWGGW